MFNFSLRSLLVATLALLLLACSPELDWREMPAADGSVRVAFPARPDSETRPLPVAGEALPFTLTTARAAGAVFAVGYLDLPPAVAGDDSQRAHFQGVLEESLTHNLQADEIVRRTVEVRHIDGRTTRTADELELHGKPGGEPTWMLARVLLLGNRLVEVAVVGPETLSAETARTFVDSLRVQ